MSTVNTERLLKLADFLDKLDPDKFAIERVVTGYDFDYGCATLACAIGWCPLIFPDLCKWKESGLAGVVLIGGYSDYYADVAKGLFGITDSDALALFNSWGWEHQPKNYPYLKQLYDTSTPSEVADNIRAFVNHINQTT